MSRKSFAVCLISGVLALFAGIPALSAAAPVITHPTGTVLATGTTLEGTNVGSVKFTSGIEVEECSTATVTLTLTANSTAAGFEADVTGATFSGTGNGGDCTGSGSFCPGCSIKVTPSTGTNGLPWCIKSTNVGDGFELRGNSCNQAARPIRIGFDLTGLVTCTYERAEGLTGTFTTDPDDLVASITEATMSRVSGFGCASENKIDLSLTLETQGSASPLYASS